MFKMRCQVCGGTHTKKNGVRKGVQLYKCKDCGHQFRSGIDVSADDLWIAYQQGKQTISELSACYGMSVSTVKRRLQGVKREWVQPQLSGEGFVHLDVTYWGRGFGVLLALDTQTCMPLYMAFVKSETVKDYEAAVNSIRERGYVIRGLIVDGESVQDHFRLSDTNVPVPYETDNPTLSHTESQDAVKQRAYGPDRQAAQERRG